MKKITLLLFLLLVTPSLSAKPLLLVLDWLINPNHAVLFVAQEQGFFEREGIKVKLIVPADPDDGAKLVAAGRADLAITYEPQLILQVVHGLPLMRIATLVDQPLNCLMVTKNSGIQQIADLKGKRIGYTSNVEGTLALKAILKKANLTLNDVQSINVQYNLTQALLTQKLDAVINVMRNVEPLQMEFVHQPVKIFPVETAIPPYDELIIISKRQEHMDPRLTHFLIALQNATRFLLDNPERSWQLFVKKNLLLNNELNHKIWQATLPYIARHPNHLDKRRYQEFMQFLKDQKIISVSLDTSRYTSQLNDLQELSLK
jgi:putative hydroxymethylpyrimidine transport system substrate-binding protein